MVHVDKVHQTSLDYWKDAVFHVVTCPRYVVSTFSAKPVIPFLLHKKVTCVWKCWAPASIDQLGIPSNMINMEMGANNDINICRVTPSRT